jgi:hypothetical protein
VILEGVSLRNMVEGVLDLVSRSLTVKFFNVV